MKKTVLAIFTFFALMAGASAQEAQDTHNIPAYRAKGYKGNVAATSLAPVLSLAFEF